VPRLCGFYPGICLTTEEKARKNFSHASNTTQCSNSFFIMAQQPPIGPPHFQGFTIALSSTPLDEWSARCRDLYLTTHNTHNRQTSLQPKGFEPAIPASERQQTHALERAATEVGAVFKYSRITIIHDCGIHIIPLKISDTIYVKRMSQCHGSPQHPT
jgi:hypothetical protein